MVQYKGSDPYYHDARPRTGILVVNLGTPDAATTPAVRRYLREFLSDPRVIETPRPLWLPILHGIILRTRPRRTAAAYARIWTDAGSPLYVISCKQAAAIAERLARGNADRFRVELAMRYGNPSIGTAMDRLREANVQQLLVLPLYPQYSAATTGSVFDAVATELRRWRWVPELRFVNHYHDHEAYIGALAESVRLYQAAHGKPDRLLFSFHGLPKHYFLAGDPYFCQCQKTARLVAEQLALSDESWAVSFQSRFGPREWLKPYTDRLLAQWAKAGIGNVQVICPGFSADCLETLEEIRILNREQFLAAGGGALDYIPALNNDAAHIDALVSIIDRHCRGWDGYGAEWNAEQQAAELEQTRKRARDLGADS